VDRTNRAVIHDPTLDHMIEAEVAEALQPYESVYPADVLIELRRMLRVVMRTHPTTSHLLEQLRPRAVPDESGKEDVSVFNGARAGAKRAEGG
jgi:hypothetical protein